MQLNLSRDWLISTGTARYHCCSSFLETLTKKKKTITKISSGLTSHTGFLIFRSLIFLQHGIINREHVTLISNQMNPSTQRSSSLFLTLKLHIRSRHTSFKIYDFFGNDCCRYVHGRLNSSEVRHIRTFEKFLASYSKLCRSYRIYPWVDRRRKIRQQANPKPHLTFKDI